MTLLSHELMHIYNIINMLKIDFYYLIYLFMAEFIQKFLMKTRAWAIQFLLKKSSRLRNTMSKMYCINCGFQCNFRLLNLVLLQLRKLNTINFLSIFVKM